MAKVESLAIRIDSIGSMTTTTSSGAGVIGGIAAWPGWERAMLAGPHAAPRCAGWRGERARKRVQLARKATFGLTLRARTGI
jgi:hypothetical protein